MRKREEEWDAMGWHGRCNRMGTSRYGTVRCVTLSDKADAGL